MFYVMVEIANFRQILKLREREIREISDQLEHFCTNRGGKIVREQSGYFLFSFHPEREKAIMVVADFLFLTVESLEKKKEDLFGFNLLFDFDAVSDATLVFNRMKSTLFVAPRENRIWAGEHVLQAIDGVLPIVREDSIAEIVGPPHKKAEEPLGFTELLELTGWIDALQSPLQKQFTDPGQGKVIRLKGEHYVEKLFVLKSVLQQTYGASDSFPVVFPLHDSQDFLSQLLSQIDTAFLRRVPDLLPEHEALQWTQSPQWEFLLASKGGSEYPGDSCKTDVYHALRTYYRALIADLVNRRLPPIFVFLSPQTYQLVAVEILEEILGQLVAESALKVIILEKLQTKQEFLGRMSSVAWTFPSLNRARIEKERQKRGWESRFPLPEETIVQSCQDRGAALAHWFFAVQEGLRPSTPIEGDPSWELMRAWDQSHWKVYYAFLIGQSLLNEEQIVSFFQFLGEDPAVVRDKIENLKALGFVSFGSRNFALREDFREPLARLLANEGVELVHKIGEYLFGLWHDKPKLSEIVFEVLASNKQTLRSLAVLSHYITHKINRNQGDFLPLLRTRSWPNASQEFQETLIQLSAAFKLRFALNQKSGRRWDQDGLKVFKKHFSAKTESILHGEWLLQVGRYDLFRGETSQGFLLLKKALIRAQEDRDSLLEVRAGCEIGIALMMKGRLEEGREYFEMATRQSEKSTFLYNHIVSLALDSTCRFLLGELSGTWKTSRELDRLAERAGMQEWRTFGWFLQARTAFDTGDYERALAALARASDLALRYNFSQAETVIRAWKGRLLVYSGDLEEAREILSALSPSMERGYFLAESYAFENRRAEALAEIESALSIGYLVQSFWGEGVGWKSGWASVEDRVVPGVRSTDPDTSVLVHQAKAFACYLRGVSKKDPSAVEDLQTLISNKHIVELDVSSQLYYFWLYLLLPNDDATHEAHRLTLLGRSLKDVQTRSSRIEDPQLRQDYLQKPYWNAMFMNEAKKQKLV